MSASEAGNGQNVSRGILLRLLRSGVAAARRTGPPHVVAFHLARLGCRMMATPLEKEGQEALEEAFQIARLISTGILRARALSAVGDAYRKVHMESRSLEMCCELLETARAISEPPLKAFHLREVSERLFELGAKKQAAEVANEIRLFSREQHVPAFECICVVETATAFARQGDDAVAESLVEDLRYRELRAKGLVMLAEAYAAMRNWPIYERLADRARIAGAENDLSDLCSIANGLADFGHFARALALTQQVHKRAVVEAQSLQKTKLLVELATLYARSGRLHTADLMVSQVLKLSQHLHDWRRREQILGRCAKLRSEAGRVREASDVAALISDERLRAEVLQHIVWARTCARRANEAIPLVKRMDSNSGRALLFATIVAWIQDDDEAITPDLLAETDELFL